MAGISSASRDACGNPRSDVPARHGRPFGAAKASPQRNRNLVHWIGKVSSRDLFLSVVTIGEIERGIERQRQMNPAFAESFAAWLDVVLRAYVERILPVSLP